MGKKYLDVKKGSLEESILDIWQTAAELEEMSAADKARKFKAMGRTKKKVTLTKSSPTGPTHATSGGGDIGGATRTGKKRPGSSQATKDYRAGYTDTADKKQSGETIRKRKEKLQGLQKKRAALSKEREKIAADYDAEILELDNLLEADDGTLVESVLDVWQTAAEGASYEIGTDEYREYLERLTPGETIEEKKGDKEAYQKFFNSALKKFGVKSPAELKGDKKKEFFDYVDKNWTGDHEEAFEFAKEAKTDSMKEAIAKVWNFSEGELPPALKKAIDDKKKDKEEKDEDKEIKGNKTLTGKKAAVVEVDPEPDLENRKKKKSDNPYH